MSDGRMERQTRYGSSFAESFRLTGVYTGRIPKGETPADLPVQQVMKVKLISTSMPPMLIARADEVIEQQGATSQIRIMGGGSAPRTQASALLGEENILLFRDRAYKDATASRCV